MHQKHWIQAPLQTLLFLNKKDEKIDSVNSASAIWTRPKNKITEEQYKEFYNHAGQMFDDPWMTSHLM